MKNRLIDHKTTKQVVIDIGYHKLLKSKAAEQGMTLKEALEEILSMALGAKGNWRNND